MAKAPSNKTQNSNQDSKPQDPATTVYRKGAPSAGTLPLHPAVEKNLEKEKQQDADWLDDKDQQQQGTEVHNLMELHQKAAPGVFRKMDPATLKKLAEGGDDKT